MAARITTVSPGTTLGNIWGPIEVERLWFFPDGSEYLRYSPHFHTISANGFHQNIPLLHYFVVVFDGKLSVKNYSGYTIDRIDVHDQVWFRRGTRSRAKGVYAEMLPGKEAYARSGRR